ncbi:FAD-binding protein [Verminephrobacter eiseniae]|uniref:FAD-binding protein n=1 Tax=Verminephrobacter eiseniae TaxID=364317 RepID=UPI002238E935|nr:FAD-binding protein [Verminephrobacter eiseniae]
MGVDPSALQRTIAEFNEQARPGIDLLFGKGASAFDRFYGDPAHAGPNNCMGPLETPPFYVIRITAGSMGTLAGLKTDAVGRALNGNGRAIDGLYAVGNDMANVFQGACPGGGITLGPGMTFGYLAGLHAADRLSAHPVAAV